MGTMNQLRKVYQEVWRDAVRNYKYTLLIVGDDAIVRLNLCNVLKTDYRVITAPEGKEGIQKAKKRTPDLIISNAVMPVVDGYELCWQLKQNLNTRHIPIILLNGAAVEDDVLRGLETGADDYVTRPFSIKILCARIKNLIELRRQLQQKIQGDMMMEPGKISVSSLEREFIKDIKAIIEENLSDPEFGVRQLAKNLYMSQSSLYRKVEASTGQAPKLYIRSYRLKRAAQLLKAKFGNVTDVAFEVGFSSTAYFTRCFKDTFHCLPSDYPVV